MSKLVEKILLEGFLMEGKNIDKRYESLLSSEELMEGVFCDLIYEKMQSFLSIQDVLILQQWYLWKKKYDPNLVKKIIEISKKIPNEFKTSNSPFLYRAVKWSNDLGFYNSGIRSWTESLKNAKDFAMEYMGRVSKNEFVVILKLPTNQNKIILNFAKLSQSFIVKKPFKLFLEKNPNQIERYAVMEDLKIEKEIIYNQPKITEKDILFVYDYENNGFVLWEKFKKNK